MLAGRGTSLNSLFHIWAFSFSGWGCRSHKHWASFFPTQGWSSLWDFVPLREGMTSSCSELLCIFHSPGQLWSPHWPPGFQDLPLETGSCYGCGSLLRRSWAFLGTQETVKVSRKGWNMSAKRKKCRHPPFSLCSLAGTRGSSAVCFVIWLTISLWAPANMGMLTLGEAAGCSVFLYGV